MKPRTTTLLLIAGLTLYAGGSASAQAVRKPAAASPPTARDTTCSGIGCLRSAPTPAPTRPALAGPQRTQVGRYGENVPCSQVRVGYCKRDAYPAFGW